MFHTWLHAVVVAASLRVASAQNTTVLSSNSTSSARSYASPSAQTSPASSSLVSSSPSLSATTSAALQASSVITSASISPFSSSTFNSSTTSTALQASYVLISASIPSSSSSTFNSSTTATSDGVVSSGDFGGSATPGAAFSIGENTTTSNAGLDPNLHNAAEATDSTQTSISTPSPITPVISSNDSSSTVLYTSSNVTASAETPALSTNATATSNLTSLTPANATQSSQITDYLACNSASLLWSSQNIYYENATYTEYGTTTKYITPANATPYTTLCDGFPRAHGTATFTSFAYTSIYPNETQLNTLYPTNVPQPNCTISPQQCSSVWSSWWSATTPGALQPACSYPSSLCTVATTTTTIGPDQPPCSFVGGHVELAYWPVSVQGDLCRNRTTITPNVTTPMVATVWGTVVTSPTILVSFDSVYATDSCGSTVGKALTNFILPQQPSQISSKCGGYHPGLASGTQVNFADFDSPIPASAYMCMPECAQDGGDGTDYCSTMYDYLKPNIAFPTALSGVMPQWQSCAGAFYGNYIWDPPTALSPVGVVAAPTTIAVAVLSTPPTPASTPTAFLDSASITSSNKPSPASIAPSSPPSSTARADPSPSSIAPSSKSPAPAPSLISVSSNRAVTDTTSPTVAPDPPSQSSDQGTTQVASPHTISPTSVDIGSIIVSALNHGTTTQPDGGQSNGQDPTATSPVNTPAANPPPVSAPVVTVGSQTIVADPSGSGVVVGGSQTLQPGQTTVISSTPISVGTSQVKVGTGSSTTVFSANPAPAQNPAPATSNVPGAIVTGGSQTLTAVSSGSAVVIGGATLSSGQQTVVNGETISDAATEIVIGSNTLGFSPVSSSPGTSVSGAIFTAGSQTLTAVSSNGNVVFGGQTLTPGQKTVVGGQTISKAGSGIVVGSSTVGFSAINVDPATSSSGAIIIVGSQTLIALQQGSGTAVVDGQTLTPGQVATINGVKVSDASTGVVVDGSTAAFSQLVASTQASGAIITAGSEVLTAQATLGTVVIGGQTLTPGQVVTVSGHIISDASTGLVVDGTSSAFSQIQVAATLADPSIKGAVFSAGSQTFTAQAIQGTAVFDGQTLTPGQVTVVNGHTVSDASTGLVVDGSTIDFSQVASLTSSGAVITIGFQTFSAVEMGGTAVFDGQTLTPGQKMSFGGHVVSDASMGLVVDGTPVQFSQLAGPTGVSANILSGAVITAGSQTYSASETGGAVILNGQTLIPGQTMTINGHIVSDASTGLVIDGTAVSFSQLVGPTGVGASTFSGAVITEGSQTYIASETSGTAVYEGCTLTPGEQIVIDGHTISDAATALIVDGTTHPFSQITSAPLSRVVLTAGSDVITALEMANGDYVLDGMTISRGGAAVTVDGQVISGGVSGLVLGGSTTLPPSAVTQQMPGVAGKPTSSKATAAVLVKPSYKLPVTMMAFGLACFLLGTAAL